MIKSAANIILCLFFTMLLVPSIMAQEQWRTMKINIESFDFHPQPYKIEEDIIDSTLLNKGMDYASWELSFIGKIKETLALRDSRRNTITPLDEEEIQQFTAMEKRPAIPYIISQAKDTEITIINEAHHMPQHRVFTSQLLQPLWDEGYRYLGLEALFQSTISDSTMVADQYPNMKSGFYTREPQFADLIRRALKIGYKVFGYESQGHENSAGREENQAQNILNFIKANPEGKTLIHCGFDHGYEGNYGGKWEKAMAQRLKEKSEIDPLTINQTLYSEHSDVPYENNYFQLTDLTEPTIYIDNLKKVFGKYRDDCYFDISVFHPRSGKGNRPKWLVYENKKVVDLDISDCPSLKDAQLVLVFYSDERIGHAVPLDITEMGSNGNVSLALTSGSFQVVVWDGKSSQAAIKNFQID